MFHYLNIRPSLSLNVSPLVLLPSALLQVFLRDREGSVARSWLQDADWTELSFPGMWLVNIWDTKTGYDDDKKEARVLSLTRSSCQGRMSQSYHTSMRLRTQKSGQIKINVITSSNENVELYRAQDLFHQNITVIMVQIAPLTFILLVSVLCDREGGSSDIIMASSDWSHWMFPGLWLVDIMTEWYHCHSLWLMTWWLTSICYNYLCVDNVRRG